MKKRIYKAVEVKQVNVKKLQEKVQNQPIVFGVDVAKEDVVGALMNEEEEVLETIKWKSPNQIREIVDLICNLPTSKLEVAMEPTGTYGDTLRECFEKKGIVVFKINTHRTHKAAEVYDGVDSSHDAKSAAIIAKLHLDKASSKWEKKSEKEVELSVQIELMEIYEKQLRANANRLEAKLARHWPEVTPLLDLASATLLMLIKEFGSAKAVADKHKEAKDRMRKIGGCKLSQEKIDQVIESAKNSIGIDPVEAEIEMLKELACETQRNRQNLARVKSKIEQLTQLEESVKNMADVVGKVSAAVMFMIAGPPKLYKSANAYLKALGLNLKQRSSGYYKGALKITKRGGSLARKYLYWAVLRKIQDDPVFSKWYQQKLIRDGGKLKMKAIIALMRKLAVALWHVGQGKTFDSTLLFDTKKLGLI